MKTPHFYVTVALGGLCLLLSIWVVVLNHSNDELQFKLQNEQAQINAAVQTDQARQKMLNEMAQISVKDDKIKRVLARNGFTVSVQPNSSESSK